MAIAIAPDIRTQLLEDALCFAPGYDRECAAAYHAISVGIGLTGGKCKGRVLTPIDQLDLEEALREYERRIAELHALLAPTVIEWMATMPDVAVRAIADDAVDTLGSAFAGLFERAGIIDRYRRS